MMLRGYPYCTYAVQDSLEPGYTQHSIQTSAIEH